MRSGNEQPGVERGRAGGGRGAFDEFRQLGWGRVEELVVVSGVPVIATSTKLFKRVRVSTNPSPVIIPAPCLANGALHRQHRELLAHCRDLGDAVIARVEVADGLPVFWT